MLEMELNLNILRLFFSVYIVTPGPRVLKLFPCTTQLSTKSQLLIKTNIPTAEKFDALSLSDIVFNIYEQDKFQAQLS